MLAAVTFIVGILLGVVVLALVRRGRPEEVSPGSGPTALGWSALISALIAVMAFALSTLTGPTAGLPFLGLIVVPITAAFAVAVGIGALRRGDRHWLTWLSPLPGLILALTWIALAVANVLGG
jgi:hypothetical protein